MNQPSIKRNYLYNTVLTVLNIITPIISFSYVSRIFGPVIIGKIHFTLSVVNFFLLLAALGIPLYGAREMARVRDVPSQKNTLFTELFIINTLSTIASLCVYLSLAFTIDRFHKDLYLFCILGIQILVNLMNYDWIFQGLETYGNIAVRHIISKILFLGAVFLFISHKEHFLLYASFTLLVSVITPVSGFCILLWKKVSFSFTNLSLKKHLIPIFALLGSALTASVYVYLDNVMLGFMATDYHVGLYSASLRISRITILLVTSIGAVVTPRLSRCVQNRDTAGYRDLGQKSYELICFLAFPAMGGIAVLAPELITLLTGNGFGEAVSSLQISSLIVPVIGLTNFIGMQVLIANRREKIVFLSTLVAAITNIILNFLLIPLFHHNGAAGATVIAEVSVLVVQLILAPKVILPFSFTNKFVIQSLAGAGIMSASIFLCKEFITSSSLRILLMVAGGATLYLLTMLSVKNRTMIAALSVVQKKGKFFN